MFEKPFFPNVEILPPLCGYLWVSFTLCQISFLHPHSWPVLFSWSVRWSTALSQLKGIFTNFQPALYYCNVGSKCKWTVLSSSSSSTCTQSPSLIYRYKASKWVIWMSCHMSLWWLKSLATGSLETRHAFIFWWCLQWHSFFLQIEGSFETRGSVWQIGQSVLWYRWLWLPMSEKGWRGPTWTPVKLGLTQLTLLEEDPASSGLANRTVTAHRFVLVSVHLG